MKQSSPSTKKTFIESADDNIPKLHNSYTKKEQLSTDHSEMTLLELVNSLKEKISIYEAEIQGLIDEKLKMQIEINNLQLVKSKKKDLTAGIKKNDNQLIELNKQFVNESSGIKKELTILNDTIQKQKALVNSPKLVTSLGNKECSNCKAKNEELNKVNSEKQNICNAIADLRKQLEDMKKVSKKKKKKKEKLDKLESLPNIEQYFILNNKFQLVDSERNLWHMKKCQKFKQFKEEKKKEFSSAEEILKAFVDIYDSKSEDESSQNQKNTSIKEENEKDEEDEDEKDI